MASFAATLKPLLLYSGVMAINILDFNPEQHQKVRYNHELYVVLLKEVEFLNLSPNDEVVIHFVTHNKIIVRASQQTHEKYRVRKKELMPVEPHIIE
ncbi:MAG: hypothetical protein WD824_17920 [Cyclobacteriaceae bacterium]